MSRIACPKCRLLHLPEEPCRYDELLQAVAGVDLSPEDDRFLRWLASMGFFVTDMAISLFGKLLAAGAAERS